MNKDITIMGLGYIGLPTAALLACQGFNVKGYDIKKSVTDTINQGNIHIVEPNLDEYVKRAIELKNLKAYDTPQIADIYMICVPTPFYNDTSPPSPNIELVLSAAKEISKLLKPHDMVILESTSPVGTTEKIADLFISEGVNIDLINIAYCPERVLPGNIMKELIDNDRIIGGYTSGSSSIISEFYKTFVSGNVFETDHKTAEMCKLTENSFRDVNIAFANELSILCANESIDVWELISLANMHPRVDILQPGTGVGGHCIAVDPWFIVSKDPDNSKLIKSAREVNNNKTLWVVDKIKSTIKNFKFIHDRNPIISCLGLSFKPNIDDLRESPAINVVNMLLDCDLKPMVVEPNIDNHDRYTLVSLEEAKCNSDIIFILVKHDEFISLSNKDVEVIDFCGALKN
jgi:UDP-N-acetyl-D-mannosaminuronic acid dehydrogenase